jgi:hypothetical protein
MADRSAQPLLAGLCRAVAEPGGLPLLANRSQPGLFAATSGGRHAAKRCQDEGLVQVLDSPTRGKSAQPLYGLTDKGWHYLLTEAPPKQLLEDFLRVLEARQAQATELLTSARHMQATLDSLRGGIERMLQGLEPSTLTRDPGSLAELCLEGLRRWRSSGDCPLPELYRLIHAATPLTIGQFHDGLRRLHETARVYLHPWTGPLYDLPEPQFALLSGHLVAYYASLRESRIEDRR